MALILGTTVSYGVVDKSNLMFDGFPIGAHLRLRQRPDDFAMVYVSIPSTGLMQAWYVTIIDNVVRPRVLHASNLKTVQKHVGPPKARNRIVTAVDDLQDLAKQS